MDDEGDAINGADNNEIGASISYSWEQSIENPDVMHWTDILFHMRRMSKIDFDGFGEPRSEEEKRAHAEEYTITRFHGM